MKPQTLYLHSLAFYRELESQAKTEPGGMLLFDGHHTKILNYLGISTSYWSKIMRTLIEHGNIVVLRKGNVRQTSLITLRSEPSEEKISESDLTRPDDGATLVARLEKRVGALEGWRESQAGLNVPRAMLDLEQRIAHLERIAGLTQD